MLIFHLFHGMRESATNLQKLRIGGIGLPDPFGIDEGLWSEYVKRWPTMEFGDLYSYLVNTEGTYRQESLKAYKSLVEAYNYFFNGYVRIMTWVVPVTASAAHSFAF